MARNWITFFNIFLFLLIVVASLNIPGHTEDEDEDAQFVGMDDDYREFCEVLFAEKFLHLIVHS